MSTNFKQIRSQEVHSQCWNWCHQTLWIKHEFAKPLRNATMAVSINTGDTEMDVDHMRTSAFLNCNIKTLGTGERHSRCILIESAAKVALGWKTMELNRSPTSRYAGIIFYHQVFYTTFLESFDVVRQSDVQKRKKGQ